MAQKDQDRVKRFRINNKYVYPKDLYPSDIHNEDGIKSIKQKRAKSKKSEYDNNSTNEHKYLSPLCSTEELRSNHLSTRRKSLFDSNSFLDLKNFDLGGSHFDAGPSIYLKAQRQKLKNQEQREQLEKLEGYNFPQQKKLKSKKSSKQLKSRKHQYRRYEYSSSDLEVLLSPKGSDVSSQQTFSDIQEKLRSEVSYKQTATDASMFAKLLKSKGFDIPHTLPLFEVLPIVKATPSAELIYQNSYILDGISYEYSLKNKVDGIRPQLNLDYKKLKKSMNLQTKPTDCDIIFGNARIILLKKQDLEQSRLGWLRKLELKQKLPRKEIHNWYDDEENLIENCCFPFFKDIFNLNRKEWN
ncbi:uncharacterized protein LOC119681402 [Teleopsis dalmanni]|uniref:uncharacterized protein LOC119681402 n=1 Tax=Teleopsis dalmanni TaxID=139649 RepID=UPI0018CE258D|nr:uncharacterized protein LOC119681402 [Teleopsis dalmanni]